MVHPTFPSGLMIWIAPLPEAEDQVHLHLYNLNGFPHFHIVGVAFVLLYEYMLHLSVLFHRWLGEECFLCMLAQKFPTLYLSGHPFVAMNIHMQCLWLFYHEPAVELWTSFFHFCLSRHQYCCFLQSQLAVQLPPSHFRLFCQTCLFQVSLAAFTKVPPYLWMYLSMRNILKRHNLLLLNSFHEHVTYSLFSDPTQSPSESAFRTILRASSGLKCACLVPPPPLNENIIYL